MPNPETRRCPGCQSPQLMDSNFCDSCGEELLPAAIRPEFLTQNEGTHSMIPNHKRVTGLSGNEIFCLHKLGMRPGQLCIGNSVVSIGFAGGMGAGLATLGGGEVEQITK